MMPALTRGKLGSLCVIGILLASYGHANCRQIAIRDPGDTLDGSFVPAAQPTSESVLDIVGLAERAESSSQSPLALTRGLRATSVTSSIRPTLALGRNKPSSSSSTRPTLALGRHPASPSTSSSTLASSPSPSTTFPLSLLPASSPTSTSMSPSLTSSSPVSSSTSTKQWLYAGAGIGTLPREKLLPGRVYTDFNGAGSVDPLDLTASIGLNAIRLNTNSTMCTGPTTYLNNTNWVYREINFQLDLGCIDMQVDLAKRAQAMNIKIVHAIDFQPFIPGAWLDYGFLQFLYAVGNETLRQVNPFLEAGIQADIYVLGTEESVGAFYDVVLPGGIHSRGVDDGLVSREQWQKEICGQVPTGHINSWPQLAAFYKHQVLTVQAALAQRGYDPASSRFALHTHGQYFQFKQDVVYSGQYSETVASGRFQNTYYSCSMEGIIPNHLLQLRTADMIDIMGFSGYALPMTPDTMDDAGFEASISRSLTWVQNAQGVAERYGRWPSGPFKGQYRKQTLILETGAAFSLPTQTDDADAWMTYFWQRLSAFESFLGALWYEPFYGISQFEGGNVALYRVPTDKQWSATVLVPMTSLKTFLSFSQSY